MMIGNSTLFSEGFTQSELQTLDNCPEKWYLRYSLQLQRKGSLAWPLIYGNWWHDWKERWYASKGKKTECFATIAKSKLVTAEDHANFEYYSQLLQIQTAIYASYCKQDFKVYSVVEVETIADVQYRGFRLRGKLDLGLVEKSTDGLWLVDHKSTYKIDSLITTGWSFRFQFMFYLWLAVQDVNWDSTNLKGLMVNAVRKPALKQNQSEGTDGFLERIRQDMLKRPDFYFYRERFHLKKGDMERFRTEILDPKIDRLMRLKQHLKGDLITSEFRNKNTDYCTVYNKVCEFLPICQKGFEIEKFQYAKRPTKHEELAE